jgi:hypothetical protein
MVLGTAGFTEELSVQGLIEQIKSAKDKSLMHFFLRAYLIDIKIYSREK